jgi:hypothetical protein
MATNFAIVVNQPIGGSTLAAPHVVADGTLVLQPGTGSIFGSPSSTHPLRVVVQSQSNFARYTVYRVTGRTTDTLTGISAIDGTADQAFAASDATVSARITQSTITDIQDAINGLEVGAGSAGTVTTVSVASANGFGGTVANATTTPAITLTTSVTGLLKGNGTGVSAAVAGTDYLTSVATANVAAGAITYVKVQNVAGSRLLGNPTGSAAAPSEIGLGAGLSFSGTDLIVTSGSGTVTSVAMTVPTWLSVGGSPVTTTGTLAITAATGQTANRFLASPDGATGAVGLRAIVAGDLSAGLVGYAKIQNVAASSLLGNPTGSSAAPSEITLGATFAFSGTAIQTVAHTGDVTTAANSFATTIAANAVVTAKILNANITYAKIQNVGAVSLLGNPTGSATAPSEITLGSGLAFSGTTLVATGSGGTVTTVSVVTANGVSGSVANATTTPAITLTLGAITPTTIVASGAISGSNLSGTNTGDQTFAGLSPLTTLGDLLVFTTVNARLAGNITTTRKFLSQTGVGASSAAPAWGQPDFTDITGSVAAAQLPNPSASTLGGVQSKAAVTNQFLTSISTSGVPTSAQPAFTDISGSVAATQLPNPSASTLGGIRSAAAVSNQWIASISTAGVPSLSQPAFSNISGTATAAQLPTTGLTITQHAGAIIVPSGTSGTIPIDLSLGDWQAPAALTGTATFTLSNPTTGQQFTVILIPGGNAVNWFSGILWPGGVTPTPTSTAGKRDVFTFKCVSAGVYLGFTAGQNL